MAPILAFPVHETAEKSKSKTGKADSKRNAPGILIPLQQTTPPNRAKACGPNPQDTAKESLKSGTTPGLCVPEAKGGPPKNRPEASRQKPTVPPARPPAAHRALIDPFPQEKRTVPAYNPCHRAVCGGGSVLPSIHSGNRLPQMIITAGNRKCRAAAAIAVMPIYVRLSSSRRIDVFRSTTTSEIFFMRIFS